MGNEEEIPIVKYGDIKLVYQYSHNNPIPYTPNGSLTNRKNRENLALYSKLENSHKYAPANLSISLFVCLFFFLSLYNFRNTYILFILRVSRFGDDSFSHIMLQKLVIKQLGNTVAHEIGNQDFYGNSIGNEIDFKSCTALQNNHSLS